VRFLRVLFPLVLLVLLAACRDKASPTNGAAPAASAPVVSDGTAGLMLTWIDDKGEFHTEQKVADVPAASRDLVGVRDPAREPTPGRVFVADLRTARADGTYAVRAITSDDFEKVAVERRKQHGTILAAASASPSAVPSAPSVVIYGAEWCGPCHQVQAYLRSKGVPFVDKDIDKDPVAASEMRRKLAKVGRPAGSIPVIDIRGRILVGFNPQEVDQALGRAM
jgi:glutaredoxin